MKLYIAYNEKAIGLDEKKIKNSMIEECFSEKPIKRILTKFYGHGILYSYDVIDVNNWINPEKIYEF